MFYLISIFPIVTGMELDSVVSLVMIPTMLMNMYLNFVCITLPKKYPEQWEKASFKMPAYFAPGLSAITCLRSFLCQTPLSV